VDIDEVVGLIEKSACAACVTVTASVVLRVIMTCPGPAVPLPLIVIEYVPGPMNDAAFTVALERAGTPGEGVAGLGEKFTYKPDGNPEALRLIADEKLPRELSTTFADDDPPCWTPIFPGCTEIVKSAVGPDDDIRKPS
jgi:hypothetical protein